MAYNYVCVFVSESIWSGFLTATPKTTPMGYPMGLHYVFKRTFRMGKSTVSTVISETCAAIYSCLKDEYLRPPNSKEDWVNIAAGFETTWNYPHCIGSLDGKHIPIECPRMSGTLYYNYKGFYSIVLLAICDARYCFTLFDLGQYGSNNDSGVLANSEIGELFSSNSFKVPDASKHDSLELLPYHLVGDEIFPLKTWLIDHIQANYLKNNGFLTTVYQELVGLLKILLEYSLQDGDCFTNLSAVL